MIFQGSLAQCIEQMGCTFKTCCNRQLAIVRNRRAKYYTLETTESLIDKLLDLEDDDLALVFHGTLREMSRFVESQEQFQLLFPPVTNGDNGSCPSLDDSGDPVTQ
jgi:hypothetical protein